jgi:hypothetical protein
MPTYRRPLNSHQIEILRLLYRFRFATTELVAYYQNKPLASSVFNRLRVLCEQEYIGRYYSKEQQASRQSAIYYLLPKGIAELRADPDYGRGVLHAAYKDKTASPEFMEHNLAIFRLFTQFDAYYGERFDMLTKSELADLPDLPQKLPDAEITLKTSARRTKRYILLSFDPTSPSFVCVKRVQELIEFGEDEGWGSEGLPDVLIICATVRQQSTLRPRIGRAVDSADTDQCFYITNRPLLTELAFNDAIWQNVVDPIELVALA